MTEARGLHTIAFFPTVRFIRQVGESGCWGECVVCGEAIHGDNSDLLEEALEQHRELMHVVMVYPHGSPGLVPRRRAAKRERQEAPARV